MIRAAIVGGTGYTGVELLRLLAGHPGAELTVITSRSEAGKPVSELYGSLRGHVDLCFSEPDADTLDALAQEFVKPLHSCRGHEVGEQGFVGHVVRA